MERTKIYKQAELINAVAQFLKISNEEACFIIKDSVPCDITNKEYESIDEAMSYIICHLHIETPD